MFFNLGININKFKFKLWKIVNLMSVYKKITGNLNMDKKIKIFVNSSIIDVCCGVFHSKFDWILSLLYKSTYSFILRFNSSKVISE